MTDIALPTMSDLQSLRTFGDMIIKTGFFPQAKTVEQACVIILKAKELGIPPVQAFTSIAVVSGKPTISAELMLSLIFKNCKGAVINYVETTDTRCEIKARRPEPGSEFCVFTFTIDDAKRAGLAGKGPWLQYPGAMLRARCISAMARALFADALSGCVYTPEELGAKVDEDGNVIDVSPIEDAQKKTNEKPQLEIAKPAHSDSKKTPEPVCEDPGKRIIPEGAHIGKTYDEIFADETFYKANFEKWLDSLKRNGKTHIYLDALDYQIWRGGTK
jgi:hypothetical protein